MASTCSEKVQSVIPMERQRLRDLGIAKAFAARDPSGRYRSPRNDIGASVPQLAQHDPALHPQPQLHLRLLADGDVTVEFVPYKDLR